MGGWVAGEGVSDDESQNNDKAMRGSWPRSTPWYPVVDRSINPPPIILARSRLRGRQSSD